ncbi:MAG: PLP-dependent transferase [Pontiellaceae bacterium]|nr:PLP-dependent transferase [Pontiellaceae bacterium]MBN2783204.1 PLP-dependent transferase [Pontiellaceae bacterium]
MPQETLRNHPLCRAEDLGKPVPNTTHAVSMCLPRWQDVVGYEEQNPATMQKLRQGYPRFFYHPLVAKAFETFRTANDEAVQIYTTRNAAERCKTYLASKNANKRIELRSVENSSAMLISYPESLAENAKEYWQHAGEGISSRCAEALLNGAPAVDTCFEERKIRERIADFTGTSADHVYLFCSGMAAIHAAHLATCNLRPDAPTAQFAFPYGDTLKLQNKFNRSGALFYPRGNEQDLLALETDLKDRSICGLFCEFPTNPLLTCINLPKLRELADAHTFPIIIDETLGACINQHTLPASDITAISLTKFFSGTGDVMGGALIINPDSPFSGAYRQQLAELHEPEALFPDDLIQLELNSRDCRERVSRINQTAKTVADFLNQHPSVEAVYYPSITDRESYDLFRRSDGGYGGLLSFVLKDAAAHTEAVYDALQITKGPNLGTSFSLCCPFTLIAHYNELEWAEAAGASRYLIRISIGLEPAEILTARIQSAINAAIGI